ncbi:hypothetical protein Afil01_11730 [Actinorhabdospora filicis]|uniref:Uncharacterized protein n=1 Tax=Actinorhabdospora filicis TaxID=1785913 RepID=A0A9W6SIU8_9ACTN|nr:hypothetical protein [Actinorhabdospora filicis]GLZ76366.1 hypothetical protein Afil01_11730 [Actinorhabdospora filicis]
MPALPLHPTPPPPHRALALPLLVAIWWWLITAAMLSELPLPEAACAAAVPALVGVLTVALPLPLLAETPGRALPLLLTGLAFAVGAPDWLGFAYEHELTIWVMAGNAVYTILGLRESRNPDANTRRPSPIAVLAVIVLVAMGFLVWLAIVAG